jgi:hypothetical protein
MISMPAGLHMFLEWLGNTKFSLLMTENKYWWAFLMDMHFVGLSLLMGTIGMLDLRILGLAKQLPVASLYRFAPWGVGGFLINLVTGGLAFIGMPVYYSGDIAFWYKMLFIILAGVNLAAFYVSGAHKQCMYVSAGEDAPFVAKIIVGISLFLWCGVIVLGRYIQVFPDTVGQ